MYRLTVTDNDNGTDQDDVRVIVNNAANAVPISDAGPDKVITLPANSTTLTGKGTDGDGTIIKYSWTKVSGPAGNGGVIN